MPTTDFALADFSPNVSQHLSFRAKINFGSFYTPKKYVALASEWLSKHGVGEGYTIADLSCGGGAFFELQNRFPKNRFVGNDIDLLALKNAKTMFPFVQLTCKNVFENVFRATFGFADDEKIVIVGNPPYNDVTSQIRQRIKTTMAMDADVQTRDLGLSSLLAYEKLSADFVAVLHPLSYLVKRANFQAAERFFANYELLEHVIFSSQEFDGTSRHQAFPIVVALYRRSQGRGLTFSAVQKLRFRTVEGDEFCLADWDFVCDYIEKYPHARRYEPQILFYTMRDINALMRSRTFIAERCANAVDVNPAKLPLYCYVDCFKRYAETHPLPYWTGNLNVPFCKAEFEKVAGDFVRVSKYLHPEIFGKCEKPDENCMENVRKCLPLKTMR